MQLSTFKNVFNKGRFFFFFLTSLFFFSLLILIISQYLKTTKLPCILYSLHANRALQSICNSVLGVSHLPLGFRFVSSPINAVSKLFDSFGAVGSF